MLPNPDIMRNKSSEPIYQYSPIIFSMFSTKIYANIKVVLKFEKRDK